MISSNRGLLLSLLYIVPFITTASGRCTLVRRFELCEVICSDSYINFDGYPSYCNQFSVTFENISNKEITFVHARSRSISILNMANNGLKNIMNFLDSGNYYSTPDYVFPELHTCYLQNNDFTKIEDTLSHYTNLKILHLEQNQINNVSNNAFPLNLEELYLQNNNLSSIETYFFSYLGKLRILNLEDNFLKSIEKNIFNTLPSLKYLYLNYNQITVFNTNSFTSLESFDSSENPYEKIDFLNFAKCKYLNLPNLGLTSAGTFNNILLSDGRVKNIILDPSSLEFVNLSKNKLLSFSTILFQNTLELNLLNLSHNSLTGIEDAVVLNLKKLTQLDLSNNKLQHINSSLISNGQNLFYLNLGKNSLTEINPNLVKNLKNLTYLHINDNNLKTISGDLFKSANLQVLDLSSNSISDVINNNLSLAKLFELNLQNNYLDHNVLHIFLNEAKELIRLNARNNSIREINGQLFQYSVNLLSLNLGQNNINVIQNLTFKNCRSLSFLILDYCNITEIASEGFYGLEKLIELNMEHNKLSNIKFSVFRYIKQLKILNLGNNDLDSSKIGNICSSLHQLNVLNLQGNKINNLVNSQFSGCTSLKELNLSNNNIKQIDEVTFRGLNNLTKLDLSNNLLYTVAAVFHYLQSLKYLDLSQNKLKTVHYGVFDDLVQIDYLDLSYNSIQEINDYLFKNSKQLKYLYLDNNKLEKFNDHYLENLKEISLYNNKWVCKDLAQLVNNLELKNVPIKNGNNYVLNHQHQQNKIICENRKTISLNQSFDIQIPRFDDLADEISNQFKKSEFFNYFENFNKTNFFKYLENLNNSKLTETNSTKILIKYLENSNELRLTEKNNTKILINYLNERFGQSLDNLNKNFNNFLTKSIDNKNMEHNYSKILQMLNENENKYMETVNSIKDMENRNNKRFFELFKNLNISSSVLVDDGHHDKLITENTNGNSNVMQTFTIIALFGIMCILGVLLYVIFIKKRTMYHNASEEPNSRSQIELI